MKKYYQVFISSASKGLSEMRSLIIAKMLRRRKYFPISMEFMSSESDTFDMLYDYMASSDVCVLILGDSFGMKLGKAAEYLTAPEMLKAVQAYKERSGLADIAEMSYTEIEYAFACYLGVKVLPFIKKSVVAACEGDSADKDIARFYEVVRAKAGYNVFNEIIEADEVVSALDNYTEKHTELSGWIKEEDSTIYKSAADAGIENISLDGFLSREKLKSWLNNADEIMLCYTTGHSFIKTNNDFLVDFISKGGIVRFLCCEPDSKPMHDVQRIEEQIYGNRDLIHKEFEDVYNESVNIYNRAKNAIPEEERDRLGNIQIGFLDTLMRSSFLLCESKDAEWQKGWFTITLPPAKSRETVTFELSVMQHSDLRNNLLSRARAYFDAVWRFSLESGKVTDIASVCSWNPDKPKEGAVSFADYWREKEKIAIANTKIRKRKKDILIEVAAQHPLVDGLFPAEEFSARLDCAARLYREKTDLGFGVRIYVPGSVHLDYDGVADEVSLSRAGVTYLENIGIPSDHIFGEVFNTLYDSERNHSGVYNTADECFVASKIFFDEKNNFGQLISVCSPNQLMRKTLFYTEFGLTPQIVTVPVRNMFHNFFNELLDCVPYILEEDHSYQGSSSKEAIRTRKERFPGYDGGRM